MALVSLFVKEEISSWWGGGGRKEGKDMLIKGFFPHEDFLFDKEKNSWLSLEVSKSFTLRQRGDHREEKNYI